MSNNNTKHTIIIEGVDRITHVYKKVSDISDKTTAKVRRIVGVFDDQKHSLAQLRARLEHYRQAAENSFSTKHIKKYNELIKRTKEQIKELENATKTCADKTEKAFSITKKLGIYAGVSTATTAISKIGKDSIDANAEVEQFSVALQTMLGNKQEANTRMREYMDIAAKTPFELQQVVDAGNKLQALGRYSRENLTMLGDLAAATSKPIDQVMGAYAKLASGQKGLAVDMFRDLLITTKDWQEATGKGIKSNGELLASTEEMISALPKILAKKGFAGMMAAQSKTVTGQISNMRDAFFQLQAAIGERMRPSTLSFVQGLTAMADKMKKIFEIPLEDKIKREQAEVNALTHRLMEQRAPQEARLKAYDELKKIAPTVLEGINREDIATGNLAGKYEKLAENLEKYNIQQRARLRYELSKQKIEEILKPQTELQTEIEQSYNESMILLEQLTEKLRKPGWYEIKFGADIFGRGGAYGKDILKFIETQLNDTSIDRVTKLARIGNYLKEFNVRDISPEIDEAFEQAQKAFDKSHKLFKKQQESKNILDALYRTQKEAENILNTMFGTSGNLQKAPDGSITQSIEQNVSEVSSLGGVKNFNININRLIEKFEISTTTIRDSQQNIKELVLKALMEAINDSQMAAV